MTDNEKQEVKPSAKTGNGKRKMSAATRKAMGEAKKKWWAAYNAKKGKKVAGGKREGWKLSAAQKAAISRTKKIWWAKRKSKKG